MGALFIFIFISVLVISALLFFNKGEKALEIKSILNSIYENFKELFSNIKKLFLILKDLTQEKLESKTTQPEAMPETDVVPASELESTSEESIIKNNPNLKND